MAASPTIMNDVLTATDLPAAFNQFILDLKSVFLDQGLLSGKHTPCTVEIADAEGETIYTRDHSNADSSPTTKLQIERPWVYKIDSIAALCQVLESVAEKPGDNSAALTLLLRQIANALVPTLDPSTDIYIKLFYQYLYDSFVAYDALSQPFDGAEITEVCTDLSTSSSSEPRTPSQAAAVRPPLPFLCKRLIELIPTLLQLKNITEKLVMSDKRSELNQFLHFMTRQASKLLCLPECNLDDHDVKAISYALLGHHLKALDISNNPMVTDVGIASLCWVLKHAQSCSLQQLMLPSITLTESTLQALVEMLIAPACAIHTLLIATVNQKIFFKLWKTFATSDLAITPMTFARQMLLLNFPNRVPILAAVAPNDAPSSQLTLLQSVTKLYEDLTNLIQANFFEVKVGGTDVNIADSSYTAPKTIAFLYDSLKTLLIDDVGQEKVPNDEQVKHALSLINMRVSEKSRSAGWGQHPITALCYSLLNDTVRLTDAMPVGQRQSFQCQRLQWMMFRLCTLKALMERLTAFNENTAELLQQAIQGKLVSKLDLTCASLSLLEVESLFYVLPSCRIAHLALSCIEPITDITTLLDILPYMNRMQVLSLNGTALTENSKLALCEAVAKPSCKVSALSVKDQDSFFLIELAKAEWFCLQKRMPLLSTRGHFTRRGSHSSPSVVSSRSFGPHS